MSPVGSSADRADAPVAVADEGSQSARQDKTIPDFFIVGAPKCGTTALASYLGGHPQIFLSRVKEPNYFCLDAPGLRVIDRLETYRGLFSRAEPGQLRGEASTAYLFSNDAVPAILKSNPAAKIIVLVRNPLEMVVAHHQQKLHNFEENEPDFEAAWRLSGQRAQGLMVAKDCRAPRYLDYQAIGRLGAQLARLMAAVPPSQLHVIVFDDLRADPAAVYRATLKFLGVGSDERRAFPVVNARKANAWPALARLLKAPPAPIRRLKRAAKRAFPTRTKSIGSVVHHLNERPAERYVLRDPLKSEMIAAFQDDVRLLGELLQRDLSHWCDAGRT